MSLIASIKNKEVSYTQAPQRNPIQWAFLYKEEDGSFTPQTGWFKCRDFFNDIVAKKQANQTFGIYGFSNENLKFNKDVVYLLVTEISNKDLFKKNIDNCLNPILQEQFGKSVILEEYTKKTYFLIIPEELFKNTYSISLLTFIIRCCNYEYEYTSWESFFDDRAPSRVFEGLYSVAQKEAIKKYKFLLSLQGWTNVPVLSPSCIHNNGFRDVLHRLGVF